MSKAPFIIIGILLVAGVFVVLFSRNNISPLSYLEKSSPTPVQQVITPLPTSAPTVAPTLAPAETPKATTATIKTSRGDITIEFYPTDAPRTVSNFAKKSESNYYKNLTFHRVEDWVIQGGDPRGDGTGGGDMPTELNEKPFVAGSVGVARGGDINISNDSQFFITKTDSPHLNKLYTNFGIVTEGMDVVNKIEIGDKILSIEVK